MSWIEQLILNVLGGALVAILTSLHLRLRKKYHMRGFKQIFGKDVMDNFFIVYGRLELQPCFDQHGKPINWPYLKPGTNKVFRIQSPVPFAETKSAKYLSETFGKIVGVAPTLISDVEIRDKLDLSFCAVGGDLRP